MLNSFTHEAIDNVTGLATITEKARAHIDYQGILQIEYAYAFLFSKNVVKLTITPHATLGDTVHFISWVDNYSPIRNDKTYTWIQMIEQKKSNSTDNEKHQPIKKPSRYLLIPPK